MKRLKKFTTRRIPYFQSNSETEGVDRKMFRFKSKRLIFSHLVIGLIAFGIGILTLKSGIGTAASVWYVSSTGNDSASGTSSAPFKTIQKAIVSATSGDTVIVKSGVYPAPVNVSKSNIILKSETNWGAVVDGGNTAPNGIVFSSGVNGVTIEGFEIRNLRSTGGSSSGIELYNGGANSTLRGNNIHSIGRQCTSTTNGLVGIFNKASNVVIENNYIHDIGRLQSFEGCSQGDGIHDHGIYMNSSSTALSGVKIRGNHFFRIDRGWAVQFYPGAWTDTVIENNIFAYGNPSRQLASIVIYDMKLTNVSFINNTFYNTSSNCKPFTLGGSLSFSNVNVSQNKTTCTGLTDTNPPSGWNASGNSLNAIIGAPTEPTSGVTPTPTPTPTPTTTTVIGSNEWSKWILGSNLTTNQNGSLTLQYDAGKAGYIAGQYNEYCIDSSSTTAPQSITFSALNNISGSSQAYFYAGSRSNILWQSSNLTGNATTETKTITLSGQKRLCFGHKVTGTFSGTFNQTRYVKITDYKIR